MGFKGRLDRKLANLSRGRTRPKDLLFGSNVIQQVSSKEYIMKQLIRMDSITITAESRSVNNVSSLHFLKLGVVDLLSESSEKPSQTFRLSLSN